MTKKGSFFRFNSLMINKLTAWNMVLKKEKTLILEEAFVLWESNQSEDQRRRVENIIKELQ